MKIKRAILVFFLGLMLVPLTCMSGFAELQVGNNYMLNGTVTLGGGWLSPSPRGMNRGYLEKYVPFPQGFLAYTDLTLKSKDGLEYYKFFMSQPGLRDQNYLLQMGKLRVFHAEFEFDEMQNIYCSFNPFNNRIGIHIYRLRASGWVNVTPDIILFAEDTFLRRTGSQPASINAGPGDPYNFRAKTLRPVNYNQNDLRVGAEYDRTQGQFRVAYHHSTFDDGGAIFLAQRPGTGAQFTQMSLPPSNSANYITAEGAINMPQYKTRLTGSISYGWLGQNETVYRNVNFLNGQIGLDQGNANLGATTFAAYFSGTSRPMDQLTLRYAYRAYNYSQDNSAGNALMRNAFTALGAEGLSLLPFEQYSYLQQTVSLGGEYKVNSQLAVNVGYAWKGFNRTEAQGTTSTNTPSVGARWCPTDWLSLMANYTFSFRRGTNYLNTLQELEAGVPVTYKFYAGTMNRNTFNFIAEVTPVQNVTCSANVSFYNDAYKNNFYGLLSDQGWSAGADVSWRPTDRIALSLGYDFQSVKTRTSAVANTVIFGEIGNVSGDWGYMLWTSDTYNTFALKGDFKLIPDKLSFTTSANYSWSNSNFHNQVIPNLNESILYTSSSFGYKINEHWACRVGYIFQYFNMSSAYQTLYLRGIGGNGVQGVQNNQRLNTLNGFYPNATAHIVQGFLQYKF
jgi:Putative outer membrane beta-barrel porin, MtrB/PioB